MTPTPESFSLKKIENASEVFSAIQERCTINEVTGCWEWRGATTHNGYAQWYYNRKTWRVSRLVLTQLHGPLTPGQLACHHCDNPKCVNPEHLYVGDATVNALDMVSRKRGLAGRTHCSKGHEYTPENTRIRTRAHGRPERVCRECCRERFTSTLQAA